MEYGICLYPESGYWVDGYAANEYLPIGAASQVWTDVADPIARHTESGHWVDGYCANEYLFIDEPTNVWTNLGC